MARVLTRSSSISSKSHAAAALIVPRPKSSSSNKSAFASSASCFRKLPPAVSQRRYTHQQKKPTLVYFRRTDLSNKNVHVADDVRNLMTAIPSASIELHHSDSTETNDGHAFCNFSIMCLCQNYRSDEQIRQELDRLQCSGLPGDGSLGVNCARPSHHLGATGIPDSIRQQGSAAAKAYLSSYPAVIHYNSVEQLRPALDDRILVKEW